MKIRDLLILKSLWREDRGNALALAAIMLPLIVGSAGLAVDTTQWVLTKRQIQQAADSAAIAGSNAAVQGGDVEYAVDQALSPTFAKIGKMSAQSTLSPDDHDGDPYAVGVRLTALGALPFSSMFLSKPITISANATATVVETGDFCAFALGSSAEAGISLQPNTSVQAECGFATNSSSSNAVTADATAKMAVPRLLAFGGIEGSAATAGSARAYALKQKDPLARMDPPEVPDTGCPNITVNAGQSGVKLQPGCYGNLVIDGDVTLEPGNYILNRGSLIVGPKADVTCNGCAIFLTSDGKAAEDGSIGRAEIDKAASVKLSAPTTGLYAGVLLYQDRRAAEESAEDQMNLIAGGPTSKLEGAVYFPSQSVKLSGNGSSSFNCARIIGRHLIFDGEIFIAKSCSTDTGGITLKASEVRLVD